MTNAIKFMRIYQIGIISIESDYLIILYYENFKYFQIYSLKIESISNISSSNRYWDEISNNTLLSPLLIDNKSLSIKYCLIWIILEAKINVWIKLTHTFIILQPETFVTGTHRSAIDFFANVIAGSVDARTLKIRFDLALW